MNQQSNEPAPAVPDRVESPAALDPTVRLCIAGAVLLGFGLYCVHDVLIQGKYTPESGMGVYLFNVAGMAGVPVGLALLGWAIARYRRVIVADADGIGYQGREKIRWPQVEKLVSPGKGRLNIHYRNDDKPAVFKLDSLNIRNFPELVALIEVHTPHVPVETA